VLDNLSFISVSYYHHLWITVSSEYLCVPLHGSQPCHGKGACITQCSYETCPGGLLKTMVIMKSSDKTGSTFQSASLSFTTSQSCSNSCPLSWSCHPTVSSSVDPFFSHLQSFPASGSFPMSQFFTSGGH
ncbi:unnamed protein product, partial [Rangifer tarandus platyrhynchus]